MSDDRDELLARLIDERRRVGRGSLKSRRALWAFCARAFREWSGVHAVADAPSVIVRRLSAVELAAWIRLAEDLPGVARDVLALQRSARARNASLALRELRWSEERVAQLTELLRYALIGARDEAMRAQIRHNRATRDRHSFANGDARVAHARKMIASMARVHETLAAQLAALDAVKV